MYKGVHGRCLPKAVVTARLTTPHESAAEQITCSSVPEGVGVDAACRVSHRVEVGQISLWGLKQCALKKPWS